MNFTIIFSALISKFASHFAAVENLDYIFNISNIFPIRKFQISSEFLLVGNLGETLNFLCIFQSGKIKILQEFSEEQNSMESCDFIRIFWVALSEFLQDFPVLENHVKTRNFARVSRIQKPFENNGFNQNFLRILSSHFIRIFQYNFHNLKIFAKWKIFTWFSEPEISKKIRLLFKIF